MGQGILFLIIAAASLPMSKGSHFLQVILSTSLWWMVRGMHVPSSTVTTWGLVLHLCLRAVGLPYRYVGNLVRNYPPEITHTHTQSPTQMHNTHLYTCTHAHPSFTAVLAWCSISLFCYFI